MSNTIEDMGIDLDDVVVVDGEDNQDDESGGKEWVSAQDIDGASVLEEEEIEFFDEIMSGAEALFYKLCVMRRVVRMGNRRKEEMNEAKLYQPIGGAIAHFAALVNEHARISGERIKMCGEGE